MSSRQSIIENKPYFKQTDRNCYNSNAIIKSSAHLSIMEYKENEEKVHCTLRIEIEQACTEKIRNHYHQN